MQRNIRVDSVEFDLFTELRTKVIVGYRIKSEKKKQKNYDIFN